jgi:hypothetical protein
MTHTLSNNVVEQLMDDFFNIDRSTDSKNPKKSFSSVQDGI